MNARHLSLLPSTQDRAYDYMRELILSAAVRPHESLPALEIASRLKVSRTPVREALSRLEQEGLVARAGSGGYVVRALSVKEIMDLFDVREALEVQAVRCAMRQWNSHQTDALRALLTEAGRHLAAGKYGDFQAANRRFHQSIGAATTNATLQRMIDGISDRIRMIGAMAIASRPERAAEVLAESEKILSAIAAGNERLAIGAVEGHIRAARANVSSWLADAEGAKYLTLGVS